MKFVLYILILFVAGNLVAQEIEYSIQSPPGGRLGYTNLPGSIDSNHFYTHREIRYLAEPANGWTEFYHNFDALEYPEEAKKRKLQASLTVAYKIDEKGAVDTVYIKSVESSGPWTKCESCEALILDYFKNAKWLPGRIGEVPVKTTDYSYIQFIIRDPNSKKTQSPFGY